MFSYRLRRVFVGLFMLWGAAAVHAGPPTYEVAPSRITGMPPGSHSWGAAIDNGKWHVANWQQNGGGFASFRCNAKACTRVGSVGDSGSQTGWGINRRGVVVGAAYDHLTNRGFVDDPKLGVQLFPRLDGGCPWDPFLASTGHAVNDGGLVVGTASDCDGAVHMVFFEGGALSSAGKPAGVSSARPADLNNQRWVVGEAHLEKGGSLAFIHDGVGFHLLEGLGGSSTWATALNERGQVVGCGMTTANGDTRAFLYENGTTTLLPTLHAGTHCANDINRHGNVVGFSSTVPWLYEKHGTVHDITALLTPADRAKWRIVNAVEINDRGEVVATAHELATGEHMAVVLRPVP